MGSGERPGPEAPSGSGEVLTLPPFEEWGAIMRQNAEAAASWDFRVLGRRASDFRAAARREALGAAQAFSSRIGVHVQDQPADREFLVATGHQPELFHPGIWAKYFLLQRLSDETGAAALDCVVDSDGFDTVEIQSPCLSPKPSRCRGRLAVGSPDGCYAFTPVPSAADVDGFCDEGAKALNTLGVPSIAEDFARFCGDLRSALPAAENIAELVTFSRRRYEASAGTDYLELPVTSEARTAAFAAFFADVALRAREFAEVHNAELADYRHRNKIRSSARPFPLLRTDADRVELPFWFLGRKRRETLWARGCDGSRVEISAEGEVIAVVGAGGEPPILEIAPKAITLTLFNRMFVSDLFIHGVGGARYDMVTDALVRRFYGVEPPRFVVASMTLFLPVAVEPVGDDEIAAVEQRLNRLTHNPDEMLGDWTAEDAGQRSRADELAVEKASLVAEIAMASADKKALGRRIRAVNEELAALMSPVAGRMREEIAALRERREAAEIMTDRTYPFCFWKPEEVAAKLR